MRKYVALLALFVVTASSAAYGASDIPNFGDRWAKSPWFVNHSAAGEYKARVFTRFVNTGDQMYSVGSLTYFKYPKITGAPAFSYQQVLDTLREGMGISSWHERTVGSAHVYEGVWAPLDRYIQVYVRENAGSVEYSVAMMRAPYVLPAAFEAEVIQRRLFNELPKNKAPGWLDGVTAALDSFQGLLVQDAEADGACSCTLASLAGNASCASACSSSQLAALQNLAAGPVSSSAAAASNSVTASTSNVLANSATASGSSNSSAAGALSSLGSLGSLIPQNEVNQVTGSINGASASVSQISSQLGGFQSTANSIATTANSFSSSMSTFDQQYARTNDILAKAENHGYQFLAAGATAAGAVTGALAANLVASGIEAGAKFILQSIGLMQKESDIQRIQRFKDIREAYEKSQDLEKKLEAKIDSALVAMQKADDYKLSNEQILGDMKPLMVLAEAHLDNAHKKLDADDLAGSVCVEDDAQEVVKVQDQLDEYKKIFDTLGAGQSGACEVLSSTFQKLDEAEGELQSMRVQLMDPKTQQALIGSQDRMNEQEHKAIARISDKSEHQLEKKTAQVAEREFKREQEEVGIKQNALVDSCKDYIKELAKQGRHHLWGHSDVFSGNIKRACEDYVVNPASDYDTLLAHFSDPSVRAEAKTHLLETTSFFADVNHLNAQRLENEQAYSQARDDVGKQYQHEHETNATLTRNAEATEGELDALTQYFTRLSVDQSGDPIFKQLTEQKRKITAKCGGSLDTSGKELADRKAEDLKNVQ